MPEQKNISEKKLSLYPLTFEEAVNAPPPKKKKIPAKQGQRKTDKQTE
jgi:hypothetical protein